MCQVLLPEQGIHCICNVVTSCHEDAWGSGRIATSALDQNERTASCSLNFVANRIISALPGTELCPAHNQAF